MKNNVSFSIECLVEQSRPLYCTELQKKYFKGSDKRDIIQTTQKFIDINKNAFEWLDILPILSGSGHDFNLTFRSDKYIGAVSLKSPETGKAFSDFLVHPRFVNGHDKFKEYTELIEVIGQDIAPEVNWDMDLMRDLNYRPPLYYEAVKFIYLLEEFFKTPWKKFERVDTNTDSFRGKINWDEAVKRSYNPIANLQLPTTLNQLSENHQEYSNIKFVFLLAKNMILAQETPVQIKRTVEHRLFQFEYRLRYIVPKPVQSIKINRSDFRSVRALKEQANILLTNSQVLRKAWRMDYSIVFERIVQYIFKQVAKESGGRTRENPSFYNKANKNLPWLLNHLEPDICYEKENSSYFVDAKYKSHLYNRVSDSIFLKEEFRKDFHQILAYSTFSGSANTTSFLCYPSNTEDVVVSRITNPFNQVEAKIAILGIPLNKTSFDKVKSSIKSLTTS